MGMSKTSYRHASSQPNVQHELRNCIAIFSLQHLPTYHRIGSRQEFIADKPRPVCCRMSDELGQDFGLSATLYQIGQKSIMQSAQYLDHLQAKMKKGQIFHVRCKHFAFFKTKEYFLRVAVILNTQSKINLCSSISSSKL